MKTHRKRLLSLLLVLGLLCSQYPILTFANVDPYHAEKPSDAGSITPISEVYINPLYADVLTEEDLLKPSEAELQEESSEGASGRRSLSAARSAEEPEYYTNIDDAAKYVREQMKARSESITVKYQTTGSYDDLLKEIVNAAMIHTGVSTEGDYLRCQYGGCTIGGSVSTSGDTHYLTITYTMTYYTSAEQEAALTEAINTLVQELDLNRKSDYEKIKAVYDYITDNVEYDYENLDNDEYKLKYTAYAALMNKTAVCQGFSNLLYRLLLECHVDCRIISGMGHSERHAWNIVKIGDRYYNVDATWDINYKEDDDYHYFLLNEQSFENHSRDDEYKTESFSASYPMSEDNFTLSPSDLLNPLFSKHTLLLSSEIGVCFRVTFPENFDPEGCRMDFVAADGRKGSMDFSEAEVIENSTDRYFTFDINALELAEKITATLHYGDNQTISNTYSAMDYIQTIQGATMLNNIKLFYLVDALQAYGYYLQDSGWTDDKPSHTRIPEPVLKLNKDSISQVKTKLTEYTEYNITKDYGTSGITDSKISLTLNAKTAINIFVKPGEGETILSEGYKTAAINNETYYQFSENGIGPKNLGKAYPISVKTDQGTATITASAMSYVNKLLTNGTLDDNKNLAMVAYFNYYWVAKDYK